MAQRYEGSNWFRQRLLCSTLSGVPVRIDKIRDANNSMDEGEGFTTGLKDYEASLLRLLEKVTKGTTIQISKTGTSLIYKPGVIMGGPFLSHECPNSRGIGYYLEVLACLAPFGKKALSINLKGVTNHPKDTSVDMFRNSTIFWMKKFGLEDEPTLQVIKRGAAPLGGGEVNFTCPIIRQRLTPIQITNEGMIKRIRGIAYSTRVAPTLAPRIVSSARELLNNFIPDVWIYTDHYQGKQSGNSPGYAIYLQAETDTDCRIAVEYPGDKGVIPEELGTHCTKVLLDEIKKGGCVDSTNQWLIILFMALCPEDVSKVRVGRLSEYSIQLLRTIKEFFGVTFKIAPEADGTIMLSCVGSGYRNISRKSN